MIRIFAIILNLVLTSLYFFPFELKAYPGVNSKMMMAVVGLSLPEATLLKKVMTWRLIAVFFTTVTLFIILSGYLFNFLF